MRFFLILLCLIPLTQCLPYMAHQMSVKDDEKKLGDLNKDIIEATTATDDAKTSEDIQSTINDFSSFMFSSGAKIWSLVSGVSTDQFHVRGGKLVAETAEWSNEEIKNKFENGSQKFGEGNRADSYDQWVIINAPLAVWIVFVIAAILAICCCVKCLLNCFC